MIATMTFAGTTIYWLCCTSGEPRWFAAGMALMSAATVLVLAG